jgi:enoyl-CoA hydratase
MSYSTLALQVTDHVAHVTLDRAKRLNTMIPEFWQEMVDVFAEIDADPSVRVVVISSSGRHFTAGLDLKAFAPFFGDLGQGEAGRVRERLRRTVLEMQESFNVIERCRLPVLAAVQGACIGGGVDLVSACDMRYCTADAFFVIQEINIGMVADVGTLQRLPHLIPAGLVRELAYTGRRLEADEARQSGLVNRVFDDHAALLDGVMEMAREIASKSPLSVHGSKEMLNYTRDHTVAEGLNYIATWQAGMLISDDFTEAARAAAEKRAPAFDDLLPASKMVRRR